MSKSHFKDDKEQRGIDEENIPPAAPALSHGLGGETDAMTYEERN